MAPIMKTLSIILLATTTIICGEHIKKSEKRGIADFGSGFSTTRLDGSGIKISTDFGKELTLEEFKQNGYKFGNENNDNIAKELGTKYGFDDNLNFDSFNFAKQFENNFNFGSSFGQFNTLQKLEQPKNEESGNNQSNDKLATENESSQATKENPENNNGESSSLTYITQKNSIPIPQQHSFSNNQPAYVPLSQNIPVTIPNFSNSQVPQPYYIYINQPHSVNTPYSLPQGQETFAPVPKSFPDQEHKTNPVITQQPAFTPFGEENINTQSNYEKTSFGEQSGVQQTYLRNSLYKEANSTATPSDFQNIPQNNNQINSHESESTVNKGFIPIIGSHKTNDFLKSPPIYVGPNNIRSNDQLSQADYAKILESDKVRLSNQQFFQANHAQTLEPNENYKLFDESLKLSNTYSNLPNETENSQSQLISHISPYNQHLSSYEEYSNKLKLPDASNNYHNFQPNNNNPSVIDSLKNTQQFKNQQSEPVLYQVVQSAGVHNLVQGTSVVPQENKYNIAGNGYVPIHQFLLSTGAQHFQTQTNSNESKM